MSALTFDELIDCSQISLIREIASLCWENERVKAIWIGGSLAAGTGDRYSDIDFRIAVDDDALDDWVEPVWKSIIPGPVLGATFMRFGESALLHHMVIGDGTIVDFYVQIKSNTYIEPALTVIACRDSALRKSIESFRRPVTSLTKEVNGTDVRQFFIDYWIITHKEIKAIGRNYSLFGFTGLYHERLALLRAWYIEQTGLDIDGRYSIHLLTLIQNGLQGTNTAQKELALGMPTATAQQTIAAVEAVRNEISATGRLLADRYEFEYPAELEKVVRKVWSDELAHLSQAQH